MIVKLQLLKGAVKHKWE